MPAVFALTIVVEVRAHSLLKNWRDLEPKKVVDAFDHSERIREQLVVHTIKDLTPLIRINAPILKRYRKGMGEPWRNQLGEAMLVETAVSSDCDAPGFKQATYGRQSDKRIAMRYDYSCIGILLTKEWECVRISRRFENPVRPCRPIRIEHGKEEALGEKSLG